VLCGRKYQRQFLFFNLHSSISGFWSLASPPSQASNLQALDANTLAAVAVANRLLSVDIDIGLTATRAPQKITGANLVVEGIISIDWASKIVDVFLLIRSIGSVVDRKPLSGTNEEIDVTMAFYLDRVDSILPAAASIDIEIDLTVFTVVVRSCLEVVEAQGILDGVGIADRVLRAA